MSCYYCDYKFTQNREGYNYISIDHKISRKVIKENKLPLSLIDDPKNLVIACRPCNSSKGRTVFFEYEHKSGSIVPVNNGVELNSFKIKRKYESDFEDVYAKKVLFSAIGADKEWVVSDSYLGLIIKELEMHTHITDIKKVKEGINFKYKDMDYFRFCGLHMSFYIRDNDFFDKHKDCFNEKNGYSTLKIKRRIFGILGPKVLVAKIISDIERVL